MDGLNYYYMIEFPLDNTVFPKIRADNFESGMTRGIAGSDEYETYEEAAKSALAFLKLKLAKLNVDGDRYKIFFEKNQFDDEDKPKSIAEKYNWEENEIIKIYIADSKQTVYNSIFKVRIFFINAKKEAAFYFDAHPTLQ